jgi:hypothetical protein
MSRTAYAEIRIRSASEAKSRHFLACASGWYGISQGGAFVLLDGFDIPEQFVTSGVMV